MTKSFNVFRLNCMMDDNKSANFNGIIVSLVSELLYESQNRGITKTDCYKYITTDLSIDLDFELFNQILEKSKTFEFTPENNDVSIKLTSEKFTKISDKVHFHSIETFIESFVKQNNLEKHLINSIKELLYQSVYENINSFTINNLRSILPEKLRNKYNKDEILAFNSFLDEQNLNKNIALFNVFLKAVEFAIVTSGKGVRSFTKDIFKGKEYCLDSNILFRILGIGGLERKQSLLNLLKSCVHQGIKFYYTVDTYKEVLRKIQASVQTLKKATENQAIDILEDLYGDEGIEFNNGFISHYAECKIKKEIRSPEQYEVKLLGDLRALSTTLSLDSTVNPTLDIKQVESLRNILYEKKQSKKIRYTKQAAKVDAVNILLVRKQRGLNDYNYSDIKSFYLTTDRTLNKILAKESPERIVETILPSQLYILHNALSSSQRDDLDYDAFNKFLKKRTTEFKYEGNEVLNFIDEIRNYTADTITIKEVIKSYSDKRYETSLLSIDIEPEYRSIKEFAETYLDKELLRAQTGNEKYQTGLTEAIDNIPVLFNSIKKGIRLFDIALSVVIIPISALLIKSITKDTTYIIGGVLLLESIKFFISSKTDLYSRACKWIFKNRIKQTSFYKFSKGSESVYMDKVQNVLEQDINIWKNAKPNLPLK
jgi:hypothetical protein